MLRITAGGALLCVTESGSSTEQCGTAKRNHPQLLLLSYGAKTEVFDTYLLVFRDGMSKRRQPEPTERVSQLPELGEKGLRLLQILGVEAFGSAWASTSGGR